MPPIPPDVTVDALGAGREALARAAWEEARAAFAAAAAQEETPEALEGLGAAAQWLFDQSTLFPAWERAYQLYRERGNLPGAARLATLLGVAYSELRGEHAIARGWLQLAQGLLEGLDPSLEHGWFALYSGHFALFIERDPAEALRAAEEVIAIARQLESIDLEVVGIALGGLSRVVQGEIEAGMRRLDQATAAAVAGEVSDFNALWNTCCYLISGCERVRDYDRAAQRCDKAAEVCTRWGIRPLFAACRTHYASLLI
ncbi:MAG: helix-turn-helix transcriptional regulator, partial [Gemmatimonadetes bacterium]|nr:helix-turn-helix transcriptional regulator [Gemmatimonadota bacterium]